MQILDELLKGQEVKQEEKEFLHKLLKEEFTEEELEVLGRAVQLLPRWKEFGEKLQQWMG